EGDGDIDKYSNVLSSERIRDAVSFRKIYGMELGNR
ncbi:hypothetical protein NPIL_375221, partial [Nephila pilipes]